MCAFAVLENIVNYKKVRFQNKHDDNRRWSSFTKYGNAYNSHVRLCVSFYKTDRDETYPIFFAGHQTVQRRKFHRNPLPRFYVTRVQTEKLKKLSVSFFLFNIQTQSYCFMRCISFLTSPFLQLRLNK